MPIAVCRSQEVNFGVLLGHAARHQPTGVDKSAFACCSAAIYSSFAKFPACSDSQAYHLLHLGEFCSVHRSGRNWQSMQFGRNDFDGDGGNNNDDESDDRGWGTTARYWLNKGKV
jgi:hypothetical protein